VTRHRCVLITKDVRDNDCDEGSANDLYDHGDHDDHGDHGDHGNHGSGCRCSVIQAPRDGGI
jgi:hypothetical protein